MTEYIFGQDVGCDIRITDDPYVSPRHARVWRDEDGVWVEDLASLNGTFIIRGPIKFRVYRYAELQPGDVLCLGSRTRIPWTVPGGST